MLKSIARVAVRILPDAFTPIIAGALSARTPRATINPTDQAAMQSAQPMAFGTDRPYVAWQFNSIVPTAPIVVLVHGWGGRATQMAPLAEHLSRHGFRCIVVDITGHGESPAYGARWEYFIRDIASVASSFDEEIYAVVAHSAGGLATMAARQLKGLRAKKYVCICAPSHPFPPIRAIREALDPRPAAMERCQAHIAAQFATSWEQLERGIAFAGAGSELQLCYDEKDRFVPHTEGDRVHALCPGSRLIKTDQFGHVRILSAPVIAQHIEQFLQERPAHPRNSMTGPL